MKNLLSIACFAALLGACGSKHNSSIENSVSDRGIYNGQDVSAEGKTWRSTIIISIGAPQGEYFVCTGIIISPTAILTAAHCLDNGINSVQIGFYEGAYAKNSVEISAQDVNAIIYPKHSKNDVKPSKDFGLLVFRKNFLLEGYLAKNISLDADLQSGDEVIGVGIGRTEDPKNLFKLRFTNLEIDELSTIASPEKSARLELKNSQAGICHGDSGGPIYKKDSAGEYQLIGLISQIRTTDPEACAANPYVYVGILSPPVIKWIEQNSAFQEKPPSAPKPIPALTPQPSYGPSGNAKQFDQENPGILPKNVFGVQTRLAKNFDGSILIESPDVIHGGYSKVLAGEKETAKAVCKLIKRKLHNFKADQTLMRIGAGYYTSADKVLAIFLKSNGQIDKEEWAPKQLNEVTCR